MNHNYSEHQKWMSDRGDETHRLNYELNGNSLIVDVGGYFGNWSEKIIKKYNCKAIILEPIKEYYESIKVKFGDTPNIKVLNYGLFSKNLKTNITIDGDSSSIFKKSEDNQEVTLTCFLDFIEQNKIDKIDLIKIDIEGSEYDLLEDILTNDYHHKINNLQIQFHTYIEDFQKRRDIIRKKLSETHFCSFNYDFIWENWTLNN